MPGWWKRLETWYDTLKRQRRAVRAIDDLFDRPEILGTTSLRPHHRGRCVYLRHEETADGRIARVDFGILRHPRPYSFSRQSHKVIEHYRFDVEEGSLERLGGFNLTRKRGLDADD